MANDSVARTLAVALSGGGSGTSNYNDLSNKPKINNVTLQGNKSLEDLGIETLTAGEGIVIENNEISIDPEIVATKEDVQDVADDLADVEQDVSALSATVAGKSSVSGTSDGTNWTALTVDGTTHNIPQGGSGTSDYEDLTNKPSINDVELSGNQSLSDLGIDTVNAGYGLEVDDTYLNVKVDGETLIINSDNELEVVGGGGGEPDAYIKNASVSGNTLTLTKKNNSTVEFSYQEGYGINMNYGYINVKYDNQSIRLDNYGNLKTSIGGYVNEVLEWTDLPYDTINESFKDSVEHSNADFTISKYNNGETYSLYGYIKDNEGTDIYQGNVTFEVTDKVDGEYLEGTWTLTVDEYTIFSGTINLDAINDTIELYNLSESFPTGEGYKVTINLLYGISISPIDSRVIPIDNETITLNSYGQLQADTTTIATQDYVDDAIQTAIGNAIGGSY